jgi:pimeloyl-ACP methyl ester carboxylesterase
LILPAFWLVTMATAFGVAAEPFDGAKSQWNGFDRYDFQLDGANCWVVVPDDVAEGRPWIWRARFFDHEPQVDLALLRQGFHLTYCDVAGLYGCPKAVERWNKFYRLMTERYKLAPKVALEGLSRGGLIIFNWAAANPEKVACIYADAPVCDIRSWPGGKGIGPGNPGDWGPCLKAYGLTEAEAEHFRGNPIDHLRPLAEARIPLLHVVGAADRAVPVVENTAIVERRYKELGGSIEIIAKPGVGHHPHSLEDPTPIVRFILRHTVGKPAEENKDHD